MPPKLFTPLSEKDISNLHIGDMVEISGSIFTMRDAVHKYLFDGGRLPFSLKDQIIYHCGPLVIKEKGKWVVKAAGPTTSEREERYEWKIIRDHKIRGIIGKGGMGEKTLEALKKSGCCYFHTIGGAAQVLAEKIIAVENVYLLKEFGTTEAIWELKIKDFPAIVTMDSHGKSL